MLHKAACPDNAPAEGFFGPLKEEFYIGREWSRAPGEIARELDRASSTGESTGTARAASRRSEGTAYDTNDERRRRLGDAA